MSFRLEEILQLPEYKWLEDYKDRLCFITLGGSHAYGTNIETSDIDVRGVLLPTKEELIGIHHFEQKLDEETDTCLYEFNKFIRLVCNCNPNVIEMLGCRDYIVFNEVGKRLIENAKRFLSKKCIVTFAGYATAQLRRLENALCHDSYSEEDKIKHIKATMEVAMLKLEEKNDVFKNKGISVDADENGVNLSIHIDNQPIAEVRAALNDLLTIEKTYNKLNHRNNKKDLPHLNKHAMHLFRLYYTVFDILEHYDIRTYRYKERDLLLEIRNGKLIKDNQLTEEFRTLLKSLEDRLEELKKTTQIPNTYDSKWVEEFVLDVNMNIVTDTVFKYKEPIGLSIIYD
jgi:predicted nucleotidyltransferase